LRQGPLYLKGQREFQVSAFSADNQKDHDSGNNNDYQHFLWADQYSRHNNFISLFIQPVSGKVFLKSFL
jgi:hypothetical protein